MLAAAVGARVFAVVGVQAVREVSDLFDPGLDAAHRFAAANVDGQRRFFVYLDHPASGGKKKRFATALTRDQLKRIRDEITRPDFSGSGPAEQG
mgnify:CR=1 FL=1